MDLTKLSVELAQNCRKLHALLLRVLLMKFKVRMSLIQQWHSSEGVWIFKNGSMKLYPRTTRLSVFPVKLSSPRTTTLEVHKTAVSIAVWDVQSGVTPCSGSQCFLCKGCQIQSLSGTPIETCFQDRCETSNTRTTSEKSDEILKKAEAIFLSRNGEYYDIPFELQRDSWRRLLKKMRQWEKLEPQDYTEWWTISHEDVSTWVNTLAKLPPTQDGEFVKGDINVCLNLQRCPSLITT